MWSPSLCVHMHEFMFHVIVTCYSPLNLSWFPNCDLNSTIFNSSHFDAMLFLAVYFLGNRTWDVTLSPFNLFITPLILVTSASFSIKICVSSILIINLLKLRCAQNPLIKSIQRCYSINNDKNGSNSISSSSLYIVYPKFYWNNNNLKQILYDASNFFQLVKGLWKIY